MDPDTLLAEIRALALGADDPYAGEAQLYNMLTELAEKFTALDEWLTKGGFQPQDWARPLHPGR